jgi:hypothetical protein
MVCRRKAKETIYKHSTLVDEVISQAWKIGILTLVYKVYWSQTVEYSTGFSLLQWADNQSQELESFTRL